MGFLIKKFSLPVLDGDPIPFKIQNYPKKTQKLFF